MSPADRVVVDWRISEYELAGCLGAEPPAEYRYRAPSGGQGAKLAPIKLQALCPFS